MRFRWSYIRNVLLFVGLYVCLYVVYPSLRDPQYSNEVYSRTQGVSEYLRRSTSPPEYTTKYLAHAHTYVVYSAGGTLQERVQHLNSFLVQQLRFLLPRSGCSRCVEPCEYVAQRLLKSKEGKRSFKLSRGYVHLNQTYPQEKQSLKYYNYGQTSDYGVYSFILSWSAYEQSDRSVGTENIIDLLPVKFYYNCCSSPKFEFHKIATALNWLQCQMECSHDLRAMNNPVVNTEALRTDYSHISYWTMCEYLDRVANASSVQQFTDVNIATALDVVMTGGMVTRYGGVFTNNKTYLYPYSCGYASNLRFLGACNTTARVSEVFVITQRPSSFNYYHFYTEIIPRLAAFVDFLRTKPTMAIHTQNESLTYMPLILEVFNLSNPIVCGDVNADIIYMPHGGGCLNAHLTSVQLTAQIFKTYVTKNLLGSNSAMSLLKRTVILTKREDRMLTNHNDVKRILLERMTRSDLELVVFDDAHLPTQRETMSLFYRSVLVLGPHGAGFSNIIFAQVGTVLIDMQCGGKYARACFRNLAYKLGLRYYSMVTTLKQPFSRRCAEEGIVIDLKELTAVLEYVFESVIDF